MRIAGAIDCSTTSHEFLSSHGTDIGIVVPGLAVRLNEFNCLISHSQYTGEIHKSEQSFKSQTPGQDFKIFLTNNFSAQNMVIR